MLLDFDNYTDKCIAALEVELASAIVILDNPLHPELPEDSQDTNIYTFGRIGGHNVVVTGLPAGSIGNSSAAHAASNMVRRFSWIRPILMVGIGDGVSDASLNTMRDVRLGDIVVSSLDGMHEGVVQYDFGTSTDDGFVQKGIVKKPSVAVRTALTKFRAKARLNGYRLQEHYEEMTDKFPPLIERGL